MPTTSRRRSSSGARPGTDRRLRRRRRPALPEGYRIRPLRRPDEIPARVDVHRAAFTPSRLTVEKYERLQTLPHYRPDDDLVVEAPDGALRRVRDGVVGPEGLVGEFEPVGTHPDHQRRGLSRALLTWGLRRYAERGARSSRSTPMPRTPHPRHCTTAVGFERRAFHRRYVRPGRPEPDLQSGA